MRETTLYVLIDQEKIKAEVIKKARSIKLKATSSRSAYVYSIPQNPEKSTGEVKKSMNQGRYPTAKRSF